MNIRFRIAIADDHLLFTEGLCALLEKDSLLDVCTVYQDGKTLLAQIEYEKPDVLLLDLKIGQPDGLSILSELSKRNLPLKVIVLSTYSDTLTMMECKRLGAHGYLLKNTNHDELLMAIERVMKNEPAFLYLDTNHRSEEEKFRYIQQTWHVTRREWEILLLIKKQFTNQMIAEHLNLSVYTVETHRKNLMQKLAIKSALSLHQFIQFHEI